jgi:Flp pilus assembly protein TadG
MNARRHSVRAGSAAIEFALVFGLLWMLLSGCFRLGYSIYVYEAVLNAVAGAARYAARVDFDEPNHTFVTGVQNMAVYGNPAGGTSPLAPGLATGNISVTWAYDAKSVPVTITLSVTGYSVNAVFQTFTWSGKPSVTVRYAGSYKS